MASTCMDLSLRIALWNHELQGGICSKGGKWGSSQTGEISPLDGREQSLERGFPSFVTLLVVCSVCLCCLLKI